MGLLDEKWGLLKAYIEANTPKNTRPNQAPSMSLLDGLKNSAKVMNQGLLNPNQYNAPSANRFKDSALGLLGGVPGVGDVASGVQAADYWNRGEKLNAGLAGLGALPLIPAIGGMFIGKGAKTWDVLKAQQADELLKKGIDPRKVWSDTGTARFPDGLLRQEIPDNASALRKPFPSKGQFFGDVEKQVSETNYQNGNFDGLKVGDMLSHDGMFSAYPETSGLNLGAQSGTGGSFSTGGAVDPASISIGRESPMYDVKSTTLHELQHAIQQREGFAKGGSPSDFYNGNPINPATGQLVTMEEGNAMYRRLAGEAEARLTQSRMNMTMPERLASYPPDMFDVPADQQIVRGLLDGPELAKKANSGGLLGAGDNAGMSKPLDYQIDHKPMTVEGGASRLDDLTGAFGEDIYGKNALQYFGTGMAEERTTLKILQSMRGKPDELVSIYRGVPDGVNNINPGDWVTLDRNVANMYADPTAYGEGAKGVGKVIELKVPAKSITSWPDSLLEFGYYPD